MCSREVIKKMLEQREKEAASNYSIINISSVHETTPMPLAAPYAASKGGMEMLTKTMALEVADKGIRINAIAPGAIATMMNIDVLEDKEKMREEENKIPMHRMGEPSEIGKVALFLASEAASYLLGTTIFVDDGCISIPIMFRFSNVTSSLVCWSNCITFIGVIVSPLILMYPFLSHIPTNAADW
jgi:NAD(P)-dependent dehydrogenase (short-subunit alcohol dehydrogenase family)